MGSNPGIGTEWFYVDVIDDCKRLKNSANLTVFLLRF